MCSSGSSPEPTARGQIFPKDGLVAASSETRSKAKTAVDKLTAGGGTAIGQWITHAHKLFTNHPAEIRHAILLTDGENEGETDAELDRALAASRDGFQCDCRGVGDEWKVPELRKIASALLGTVDVIPDPEDMPAEFRAMMESAMAKETGDVALRIWSPQGASPAVVMQVAPTIEDLTAKRCAVSELVGDYPTGAWGDESRDYHVSINVPARAIGEEMLAARVSLVVDGEVVSDAKVHRDLDRRRTLVHRHQSRSRALHGAGRDGGRDRGWARGAARRR